MAFSNLLQMPRTFVLINAPRQWQCLSPKQLCQQLLIEYQCYSSGDNILNQRITKEVTTPGKISEKYSRAEIAERTVSDDVTDKNCLHKDTLKVSEDVSFKSIKGRKDGVEVSCNGESYQTDPSKGQNNVEVTPGGGQKGTGNAPVQKRKRKTQLSETMKVLRDKKMLEKYQQTSKMKKMKSSSPTLPFVLAGEGYKEQLLDYISRHDETWERYEDEQQFAVSKSGKVLIFPLRCFDGFYSQNLRTNAQSDESTKVPSVTSILSVTKPMKQVLSLLRWEKKMTAELGEEGFQEMKQGMFREGHQVHRNIEKYLTGTPEDELEIPLDINGYWESCRDVLPRIDTTTDFEIKVKHPVLSYLGYIDCVAEFDGKMSLIEWKTSRKPKLDLRWSEDYALQAVAYLGAFNFDPRHTIQVEQIVIVVTYKDGLCATVHILDEDTCDFYWNKWLGRLLEYREIVEMKKDFVKQKIIEWKKSKPSS